ncbi:hypothetical protein [Frigoribacterium sp. PhB24]|uniref:hypothetical protein n=1 Tax=Frigoribacterium sp. PhB24 TaxID=2485204 RepID=UPI000F911EE2|nr:hypothetical protein [Frigoribacterium sp. PhB24]ROS51564.1 hypothetical protein EDF50_1882 [Frigoribacterium sp. PhB24]
MADGLTVDDAGRASSSPLSRPDLRRPIPPSRWLLVRYRLTPWWARVLVVFVLSRVVSTIALLTFAGAQQANAWTLASPNYGSFATIWDGHWYYIIAVVGYPSDLPITGDGHVGENAWAFMPAYPFIVRGLMTLTGLPFATLAVAVSVACAAGTALLFYRLMRHSLSESTSLFAVVLFCVAPLSPLLQVAYAESMFLFLLCASLLMLVRRQYLAMLPVVLVLSFTRPGALPLALAIGLHGLLRWWHRRDDPFPVRDRVRVGVSAAVTAVFGVAWLVVAGAVTGVPGAYTETELAWRAPYIGYGPLVPFTPWVDGANWWFPGGSGIVLLGVVLLAFAALMLSPWARRTDVDLGLWAVAYTLYLLAVFFPQSSTWRLLMPLFPVLGVLAVPRSTIYRAMLVAVFLAAQWVWLYYCWWVNGYDWTPP